MSCTSSLLAKPAAAGSVISLPSSSVQVWLLFYSSVRSVFTWLKIYVCVRASAFWWNAVRSNNTNVICVLKVERKSQRASPLSPITPCLGGTVRLPGCPIDIWPAWIVINHRVILQDLLASMTGKRHLGMRAAVIKPLSIKDKKDIPHVKKIFPMTSIIDGWKRWKNVANKSTWTSSSTRSMKHLEGKKVR